MHDTLHTMSYDTLTYIYTHNINFPINAPVFHSCPLNFGNRVKTKIVRK